MKLLPPLHSRLARKALRLGSGLALLAVACTTAPPAPEPPPVPALATTATGVAVPDLRGLSLHQARERLSAAGLLPGSAETTSAPAGMVWHQSLPAGSLVAAGTAVDLEVIEQAANPLGCPSPDLSTMCSGFPLRQPGTRTWRQRARLGPPRLPPGQLEP